MKDSTYQRINRFNEDRDWAQFHSPENLAKSIAIEAGELLELFQWNADAAPEDIRDELADVIIYAIDMAHVCGLDADTIVNEKLNKNEAKYPVDKARGNSKKYTELQE